MTSREKVLNLVKYIGLTLLISGSVMFLFGFIGSGFGILTPIGLGMIVGAVFIFLIGVFFVATEEMIDNTHKGIQLKSMNTKKGAQ
ncbi:hypothetical protein EKG37_19985 [Robertmurraya yapensis]|uniref:Uncharacterized protein n=1 Tax=Bacillus yapensis TaxID=2492960 RepID=A0A3S0I8H7_9BACI|nr:hypothetical protein [Bacillus yapensis]RTR27166.1 hypothetical protein EKG37_19985 [Bacillus yapensis]TKS94013.1 hypothetical protein FAR12_19990 [Bacillus yapensis]